MYNTYNIPCEFQWNDVAFSITSSSLDLYHYHREGTGDPVDKKIISHSNQMLINPVEPLNTPKFLTQYLLIEMAQSMTIAPKMKKNVYLTFPLDLGVYFLEKADFKLIDVFTLASSKYTLYGDPRHGVLCKYWESPLFESPPTVLPCQEGVLQLNIYNSDSDWVEVHHVVLNAYGMKIFYNDATVTTTAMMEIRSKEVAETDFDELPPAEGMKKSIEVFHAKKLSVSSKKYLMEFGI
ncbi:MAG: DUF432 domain-containing protein [SAR324 cluster bacterium]|nr:DUF432 domain-containing protein [SAR324 cluster bacterium]